MPDDARLESVLREAQGQGLLPADAVLPAEQARPWPVALLSALGAWLAAIPLILMIGALLGDVALRGPAPYVIGALLLAAAVVVLRAEGVRVFVEQLAVPALLTGGGTVSYGLARDLQARGAAAVLCALALVLALLIPRAWLRVLLGALAAALAAFVLSPTDLPFWRNTVRVWLSVHGIVALGLLAWAVQQRAPGVAGGAAWAGRLEPIAAGWLLATLAALAVATGMTLMVGGLGGGVSRHAAELAGGRPHPFAPALQVASAVLALAGCALVARCWPALRQPLALAVALVLALLASFLPMLGAALLVCAAAAVTHRWRMAGAAALACAWIVGAFYYRLEWPLATKALVLAASGAVLAGLAYAAHGLEGLARGPRTRMRLAGTPAVWIGLSALASLLFVNQAIWQKERLIARGDKVFVALAPVDPRSLLQGDYMRLNYRVPETHFATSALRAQRPYVVARRDARGVAELVRASRASDPLAPGEFRIELTPAEGRWTLVSDAWFFREGDAKRWEAARFAEFRVDADGRALLVGLADDQLRRIPEQP